MMATVSVIVPVYNVETYLERCVQSVLSQTYTDFELILIDDGSTDRSGIICDEYAAKDPRIKVVHQKNAGVSAARNYGLELAKGEFVTFCDSDDELVKGYLQTAIADCETSGLDVWIGTTVRVDDNGKEQGRNEAREPVFGYSDNLTELQMFQIYNAVSCVAAKVWKREAIGNVRFDLNLNFGEDLVFAHTLLMKKLKMKAAQQCAYIYHMMETGLTLNVTLKKCESMLKTYRFLYHEGIKREYQKNGVYYNAIDDLWIHDIRYVQTTILRSNKSMKEQRRLLNILVCDKMLYSIAVRKGYRHIDPFRYRIIQWMSRIKRSLAIYK